MLRGEETLWTHERLDAEFKRDKVIGRGRYGHAVLWLPVAARAGVAPIVVKQIPLEALNDRERTQTANEVALLRVLRHPNVIGYLGSYVNPELDTMNIVLEYAGGGTLADAIKQARSAGPLDRALVRRWFVQLSSAVEHMHESHILHRDIKTANIFLTSDLDVKIGDFGVSRLLSESRSMANTLCGTPYYLSPELVRGQSYSKPADLWAIGCVMFELLTLSRPFAGGNIGELVMNITRGRFADDNLDAMTPDEELRGLVRGLLHLDPDQRLNMRQVMATSYVHDAPERQAELGLAPLCSAVAYSPRTPHTPSETSPKSGSSGFGESSSSSQRLTSDSISPELELELEAEREPASIRAEPRPSMLELFALRRGSSSDLLHSRDSVSDAARRARRRRNAQGSPNVRIPVCVRSSSSANEETFLLVSGQQVSRILGTPTTELETDRMMMPPIAQLRLGRSKLSPVAPRRLGQLSAS